MDWRLDWMDALCIERVRGNGGEGMHCKEWRSLAICDEIGIMTRIIPELL